MSDSQKAPEPQIKKFGKGERKVPHHSDKASKYYPAEEAPKPKTVCVEVRFIRYIGVVILSLRSGNE